MAEMQPTMEILAKISKNSQSNKNEVFTKLFRYLLRPDIYFEAYKNLYANNGAATKGVNGDTADEFSEVKIAKIINSLKNETYQPLAVRRTYIAKANNSNKKRPLGIPTFTDKLVQEVLRMVLEAVYEPVFLNCSHAFRPNRSCHTALKEVKRNFAGSKWFIEGDIKGCFDNINHVVLVGFLNQKVKDARIIKLIHKFLKAGYVENRQYYNTYSGTPQGGIISPLLANIYLHELDKYVMKLKTEFDKASERNFTPQYEKLRTKVAMLQRKIKKSEGIEREQLIEEHDVLRAEMLKTPCKSQTDKKLKYVRYADDFMIAVNGNREDCVGVKRKLSEFIGKVLKVELSEEKTLITHSSQKARFLGYDVRVRRDQTIKHGGLGNKTKRTLNNTVELTVPLEDKIHKFLFVKGIVEQTNKGKYFPVHRPALERLTDLEIVSTYNSELRGICNYYNMACNFNKLNYFSYLMEYSCLKTLAGKHKSTISKTIAKNKDGKGKWGIEYETKKGKKRLYFADYSECKKSSVCTDVINNVILIFMNTSNSLEKRLKAKVCEFCGTQTSDHYELHHVNKLKNLKGKKAWERTMIAKRRKTLVVCRECHHKIHNNKF